MIQAKTFMAENDDAINAILAQVPDGCFKSLSVLGDYRAFGRNSFLLLMDVTEPINITDKSYFEVKIAKDKSIDQNPFEDNNTV